MDRISELEAAVLCTLRRCGGCTPYRVRQALAESPTPRFSGSTGAIYPLIRRLESRGLVVTEATATGRRAHRVCRATAAGLRALRQWIVEPGPADFGIAFDPLLTRVNMLAAVSDREARRFLETAIEGLEASLEAIKPTLRHLEEVDPPFSEQAARYSRTQMRARIKWLRSVLAEIS